jgi:hypothetical protein
VLGRDAGIDRNLVDSLGKRRVCQPIELGA